MVSALRTYRFGLASRPDCVSPAWPGIREGDLAFGRYELTRALGLGASSASFRARDRLSGGSVVLKRLRPGLAAHPRLKERIDRALDLVGRRTERVAGRVARWRAFHPPDTLVFDHVPGLSLHVFLNLRRTHQRPLDAETAGLLLRPLAECVDGWRHPHGALTPRNVMLGASGPTVTDYGLAQALPVESWVQERIVNNAGFDGLAPERWQRGAPLHRAADVYSLAWLSTELLTLRVPCPALWGMLRPPVRDVLVWGLHPDPGMRPSEARPWVDKLIACCGSGAVWTRAEMDGPTVPTEPPAFEPSPEELEVLRALHASDLRRAAARMALPKWLDPYPDLPPQTRDRLEGLMWASLAGTLVVGGLAAWLAAAIP
ncbi:MAG: hypothetical protein ACFB9M_07140 [Myxococcota bacterium]